VLQFGEFLLALGRGSRLGKLRFPRFRRRERPVDQLAERLGVRGMNEVDQVHERDFRARLAVLGELILIEARERQAQAFF